MNVFNPLKKKPVKTKSPYYRKIVDIVKINAYKMKREVILECGHSHNTSVTNYKIGEEVYCETCKRKRR